MDGQNELTMLFKEFWFSINYLTALDEKSVREQLASITRHFNSRLQAVQEADIKQKYIGSPEERKMLVDVLRNLTVSSDFDWNMMDVKTSTDAFSASKYKEQFSIDFKYSMGEKSYSKAGYFLFRVRLQDEGLSSRVRPNGIQQAMTVLWGDSAEKPAGNLFLFDRDSKPYVFSVCTTYTVKNRGQPGQPGQLAQPGQQHVDWTTENVMKYGFELGQWAEIYSGHYRDYKEEIFKARVEHNLSNRVSEVHLVNRTSSLLFLEPDNYTKYFYDGTKPAEKKYILESVVKNIARLKLITFALQAVNGSVDDDATYLSRNLSKNTKLEDIQERLDRTAMLKNGLQAILAHLFSELLYSHRQHYAAILNRIVSLDDMKENWKILSEKILQNSQTLNSIYLEKQGKISKRQQTILALINILLGAGIIFDIITYVFPEGDTRNLAIYIAAAVFAILLIGLVISALKGRRAGKKNKKKDDERKQKL